jgi:hypothetical protein
MCSKFLIALPVGLALIAPINATSSSDETIPNSGAGRGAIASVRYGPPVGGAPGASVALPLDSAAMATSRGGSRCPRLGPMTCKLKEQIRKVIRRIMRAAGGASYVWSSTESVEESLLSAEDASSPAYDYDEYYAEDHVREEYYETEADAAAGAYWGVSESNSGMYYSRTVYYGGGGGGDCGEGCELPY